MGFLHQVKQRVEVVPDAIHGCEEIIERAENQQAEHRVPFGSQESFVLRITGIP
jgi:hypothetical protein